MKKLNKSALTNIIAAIVFLLAYFSPPFPGQTALTAAGLFALSGALTNWLAVYMLFERVPGLYGSGIVEERFEEFKSGIRTLIINNFFTEDNFAAVARSAFHDNLHLERALEKFDFDTFFDGFVQVVKLSKFGSMLSLVGGEKALQPLREPFRKEFERQAREFLEHININTILEKEKDFSQFRTKVETMIDAELDRLTPQRVKQIVEDMIREHLGWLVVWGGVFGALIGVVSTFLP